MSRPKTGAGFRFESECEVLILSKLSRSRAGYVRLKLVEMTRQSNGLMKHQIQLQRNIMKVSGLEAVQRISCFYCR
jgi:hypothetical protein